MGNRVARLRVWLLGSAVFLVLVIAAYVGYARMMARLRHLKLPSNLGVNVVREAGGWTLSRSKGSKTLYTIHATSWDQGTNGKMALHDVSILLYGQDGSRRDRIYGNEFEYDTKEGVVRALGLVHMDLQGAGAAGGVGSGSGAVVGGPDDSGAKVMHVVTSGLVYLEKLGVAATGDAIEFHAGTMTGHARGADFASDSGMLMLHSAVSMNGVAGGRPVEVTAATAEFDDRNHQAFLTQAKYVSEGRTATADQATLYARAAGAGLERVEGQGHVTVQANGGTLVSQKADAQLNEASQPKVVLLTGGVRYSAQEPLREAAGQANEATITFDGEKTPQPGDVLLNGAVHLTERTRATEAAKEPWSTRELTSAKVAAVLAPAAVRPAAGKAGQAELRNVEASGGAHLTMVDGGTLASSAGKGQTEVTADDLRAVLKDVGAKQPELDTVAGRGHTVLRQVSSTGGELTSMGDSLDAKFKPSGKRATKDKTEIAGSTLASGVQQGHVTAMQRVPAKGAAAADVERATAERVVFDGDANRVTLTGGVQLTEAGSALWANEVALDRVTGDSAATGAVRVDYVSNPTHDGEAVMNGAPSAIGAPSAAGSSGGVGEPAHVLAERAESEHATGITVFHGKPVRLWQGGSQVQAPVVEVSREAKRLIARGEAGTGWSSAAQVAQVHTVLMSGGSGAQGAGGGKSAMGAAACAVGTSGVAKAGGSNAGAAQAIRIASGGLVYSGILGQADFTGGVRADTADSTIRAGHATAYLDQKSGDAAGRAVAGDVGFGGNVNRVVADGHVVIDRPGMQATGERLVYTAADQVSLLTGDAGTPPRAVGAQGTTTAAALRLRNSCENGGVSVEALGEVPGEPPQRVRTEARVSRRGGKEKGNR